MKKIIKTIAALGLTACVATSFSACNLFATMRQNAENAKNTTFATTPEDEPAFEQLNNYIDAAFDNAVINESVSYKAGGVSVKKGEDDAGLLDDAANTLKGFIMNNKPGSSDREITDRKDAGILGVISSSEAVEYEITRDLASENVTDENEKEVTLEDGTVETTMKECDNYLNFLLKYYATRETENEDGEMEEEYTPIDDSSVEAVFGEPADESAVLANFDCVKEYITVDGYSIAYGNCELRAKIDMETAEVISVEFVKKMNVTATVTGVGALEKYGEMTVEFELTKTVTYSFEYAVPEE